MAAVVNVLATVVFFAIAGLIRRAYPNGEWTMWWVFMCGCTAGHVAHFPGLR